MYCNQLQFNGIIVFSYTKDNKDDIQKFKEYLWKYVKSKDPGHTKYPIWMLKEFVSYWTSRNDNGNKPYFKMEKKWNTGLRLSTWKKNCAKDDRWKSPSNKTYKFEKPNHDYTPPPVDYSKYQPKLETRSIGELIRRQR